MTHNLQNLAARRISTVFKSKTALAMLLLGGMTSTAQAELVHVNTWYGWGDLPIVDVNPFYGAHMRAPNSGWEVGIWEGGHHNPAGGTSEFSWVNGTTYYFDFSYDQGSGDVVYNLYDADPGGGASALVTLTPNIGADLAFDTFYVYAKNPWQNEITIENLEIDGLLLESIAGFDGIVATGFMDGGTEVAHETVKFEDLDPNGILSDGVDVSGQFYLNNPTPVSSEQMQITFKLFDLLEDTPAPAPGSLALMLLGFAGLRRLLARIA